jgi:hypothetical protein
VSSTPRNWGQIFQRAAAAGFAASGVLHLSTFTPLPPEYAAAAALVLFAGAFVLLAALIVRLRESGAPARGEGAVRVVEWRRLLALIPDGPRHAALAVVGYVLLNLVLSLFVLGDAGLSSVRLLSGHLLLFYVIPLTYFRFVEPRLRDGDGPSHP